MFLINYLQTYIDSVKDSDFTTVFSTLDHDIVHTKDKEKVVSCLAIRPDVSSLTMEEKLALVTTVEEFFVQECKNPPSWIFEDEFYANPPIYPKYVLMIDNSFDFLEEVKKIHIPYVKSVDITLVDR